MKLLMMLLFISFGSSSYYGGDPYHIKTKTEQLHDRYKPQTSQ